MELYSKETLKMFTKKIVIWRRNLLLFPTGNRSKLHIDEMRHILIGLVNENAVKDIAFTAHKSVLLTGTSQAIDLVKKTFPSGFSITNTHDSQDRRRKGKLFL